MPSQLPLCQTLFPSLAQTLQPVMHTIMGPGVLVYREKGRFENRGKIVC